MFKDWRYVLLFAVCVFVAPVLGFFLGLPLAFVVIGPLYRLQAWRNGAPFRPGDHVRVLVGPHCGRVTQVREHWQGNSLRVELGPEAEKAFQDIFSPTQLLKTTDLEPCAES
jgi:hypothetical protein